MSASTEPSAYRERLYAMILELPANNVVLDRLSSQCAAFRFIGGVIPAQRYGMDGMTSCLTSSPSADRVPIEDIRRYRALIGTLAELQLGVTSAAGPKSRLPVRFAIADAFDRTLSEIVRLGKRLQMAMKQSLDAREPSSAIY